MDDKALIYIGLVNDHQHFPAAQVTYGAQKGVEVFMYQRTSSSTASMNTANKSVWARTAVDPINAMILLLKMEEGCYKRNREKAWSWKEILTPHGKGLSKKAFKFVNPRDYSITIESDANCYNCYVSKNVSNYNYICWFPVEYADNGSLFGGCSCGILNTDGMPCHHMVTVVKSYRIEGLNETNVTPIWWHTSHWWKQYPSEQSMDANFNIQRLHRSTAKIDESYVLCPPYTCP
jgi:hypothetical protein